MELIPRDTRDGLEIAVKGRLDAYWSDHLSRGLQDHLREGASRLVLDLSEVTFLSSAGIRVLISTLRQLEGMGGSFRVANPSEQVKATLGMAGLLELLVRADEPEAPVADTDEATSFLSHGHPFELFDLEEGTMSCRVVGDPSLFESGAWRPENCWKHSFPSGSLGLGLGAFGSDFEESRERFGECLAIGGAAVYLPTDGTNVPDFVVSTGALVPELHLLYGLRCDGPFTKLLRFRSHDPDPPLTLSELAGAALDAAGADSVAMALVAETASLVGASRRRSPALGSKYSSFSFPEIREWLSFATDRAFAGCQSIVVGVASRAPDAVLAPLLRPLASDGDHGHFHAAAFSYRPIGQGVVHLDRTVAGLLETQTLRGVLHLLNDDRELVGAGESRFANGACWLSPLRQTSGDAQ